MPPGIWPVARVIEVYPGADGFVRSVKIKTPTSELVRPVNKLILIVPIEPNTEQNITEEGMCRSSIEPNDAEAEAITTQNGAVEKQH